MSKPALGQQGQTDQPQCYNCGTTGHWAVACPDPTRETPAGLAAWRNSSTPNYTNPKGQGPGSNKRSKGPIITKYGPPPPPPFGQGMNHLPPPPPGHHPHPPTSYPPQAPTYPTYAPPPPPPAYSGSFPAPAYGYPPHHPHPPQSHPQYQPPPPHGAPHFGPPGYIGPPPALGPPPGSHFPAGRGDGHEYRPPQNQAFSRSPPSSKPSPPVNTAPPQNRKGSRPNTGSTKPPSLPPKPPVGMVAHPLPPKPPKSHDQANQPPEHRNKHKNDRRNKGRDRRQSNDHHIQRHPTTATHRDGHTTHSPENRRSSNSKKGQRQNHGNANSKNHAHNAGSPNQQTPVAKAAKNGRRVSNDHVTPRRASSDNFNPKRDENGSALAKTTPHTGGNGSSSATIEAQPSNKHSPQLDNSHARSEISDGSERRSLSDNHAASKHAYDQDVKIHEREPKRPKLDNSPKSETKKPISDEGDECIWDTIDVPREADRRQQAERDREGAKRRGSTASLASKHSSQSSRSSDLNSLEAELLGRPAKHKSPERSSVRHRSDHHDRLKPNRRQANSNSAYSRRW